MSKIFKILFSVLILGIVLLFVGARLSSSFFASFGLIITLLLSPVVLIISIYEIRKKPKNWILPLIAILISLFGTAISFGVIIALKNFT